MDRSLDPAPHGRILREKDSLRSPEETLNIQTQICGNTNSGEAIFEYFSHILYKLRRSGLRLRIQTPFLSLKRQCCILNDANKIFKWRISRATYRNVTHGDLMTVVKNSNCLEDDIYINHKCLAFGNFNRNTIWY